MDPKRSTRSPSGRPRQTRIAFCEESRAHRAYDSLEGRRGKSRHGSNVRWRPSRANARHYPVCCAGRAAENARSPSPWLQRALEAWLKVHPLARGVGLLDEQPLFVRLGRHGHEQPLPLSAVAVHRLVRRGAWWRAYWSGSRTRTRYAPTGPPTASRRASPSTPSRPVSGTSICGPPAGTPAHAPSRSTTSPMRSTAATRPPAARAGRCNWAGDEMSEFRDDDAGCRSWIDANQGDLPVRRHHRCVRRGCPRVTDTAGARAGLSAARGSIAPVRANDARLDP